MSINIHEMVNSKKEQTIMNRRQAREKAMQILFQVDMNEDQDFQMSMSEFIGENKNDPFFKKLLEGVLQHRQEIDQMISNHLENWTIDRIASVEKTVLRIAFFEMHYLDDIPKGVSINEAVELAKKFGDEKSGSFVNGVLSKIT